MYKFESQQLPGTVWINAHNLFDAAAGFGGFKQSGEQHGTACPRSSDPFYKVSYCMKWVTTSWTYSTLKIEMIINNELFSKTIYCVKNPIIISEALSEMI